MVLLAWVNNHANIGKSHLVHPKGCKAGAIFRGDDFPNPRL